MSTEYSATKSASVSKRYWTSIDRGTRGAPRASSSRGGLGIPPIPRYPPRSVKSDDGSGHLDRPPPLGEVGRPLLERHPRLEAPGHLPGPADLVAPLPDPRRQAGQEGRAQRGGFDHARAHHRYLKEVGLELHEQVVARGAPVHLEDREGPSRLGGHLLGQVVDLEGDPLQ